MSWSDPPPTRRSFRDREFTPVELYIGREHRDHAGVITPGSEWANPFKLRDCKSRTDCLARYRAHLRGRADFPSGLHRLSGRCLVCHCTPAEECHADVLIDEFLGWATRRRPSAGQAVRVKIGRALVAGRVPGGLRGPRAPLRQR